MHVNDDKSWLHQNAIEKKSGTVVIANQACPMDGTESI